jgi:hypothetical protein
MNALTIRGARGEVITLPPEADGLPEKQRLWALYRAEGASLAQATYRAGYDPSNRASAKAWGFQLSVSPPVAAAVAAISRQLLKTQTPRALATVNAIMEAPTAKDVDRLRAAKMILDRGGVPSVQEHHTRNEHLHHHTAGPQAPTMSQIRAEIDGRAGVYPTAEPIDAEFEPVAPAPPYEWEV